MTFKLGKKAPRIDARTLSLSTYIDRAVLPAPPESLSWTAKMAARPLGVMLNDRIGCCTCAAIGHLIQDWTANAGKEVTIPDSAVLSAYEAVSGYNPRDPSTDQGAVVLDVLSYCRRVGIGGHKIGAYVSVDVPNVRAIEQAVALFGGVDIGFTVTESAMKQFDAERMWHLDAVEGEGEMLGGHSVAVVGYDPQGLTCVTWGKLQKMSWAFWMKYCDEAWAILSQDFLSAGKAPNGFNLTQLIADLSALGIQARR